MEHNFNSARCMISRYISWFSARSFRRRQAFLYKAPPDQCPMQINADQSHDIFSIDRNWSTLGLMPEFWSALIEGVLFIKANIIQKQCKSIEKENNNKLLGFQVDVENKGSIVKCMHITSDGRVFIKIYDDQITCYSMDGQVCAISISSRRSYTLKNP